ncbi:hypothetical protein EB796_002787 [Bugula neritina]|uniref:Peptidase M14 domain-containing protein n=1 Tax=Bugula neritina TaxID=10212 RepID=A0A7J7KLE9_BUGNE|nr:hypothetical protein EB796_002787 [Bugula neritina]
MFTPQWFYFMEKQHCLMFRFKDVLPLLFKVLIKMKMEHKLSVSSFKLSQILLFLYFLFIQTVTTEDVTHQKSFTGEQVWRIQPATKQHIKYLRTLQKKYLDVLDFWTLPSSVNHNVDVRVPNHLQKKLKSSLKNKNLPYATIIQDVQKLIEEERQSMVKDRKKRSVKSENPSAEFNDFILDSFVSHQEINQWLTNISSQFEELCSTFDIGETAEGRIIRVIKISLTNSTYKNQSKRAIWVEAGMHGREWISPVTANNIIYNMITMSYSDRCVKNLLEAFDWYILPVANPDGYEYSRSRDRMWRKNRRLSEVLKRPWWSAYYSHSFQRNKYRYCYGVDLNRNFGFKWGVVGTSTNPCSEIYQGPAAFSEPETAAIRDFASAVNNDTQIIVYLSLHSYGQMWLYSWGYTRQRSKDHKDLRYIANQSSEAIFLASQKRVQYTVGPAARTLYASSGCSDDWAKGSLGVKYAFTLELPPSDTDYQLNGFLLPASAIPSIRETTWTGVKTMAELTLAAGRKQIGKKQNHLCRLCSHNSSAKSLEETSWNKSSCLSKQPKF